MLPIELRDGGGELDAVLAPLRHLAAAAVVLAVHERGLGAGQARALGAHCTQRSIDRSSGYSNGVAGQHQAVKTPCLHGGGVDEDFWDYTDRLDGPRPSASVGYPKSEFLATFLGTWAV